MIYKSIEIEFCQRNSWANKFMVDYGKNWTVACQSGKSWGINQRQANASQPDRWHTADMMAIWLGPLENGNWNHSEPIIGHLSGISESLAEFLNWKMQIFAGRCWLLFLESQTEKAEKNWIDRAGDKVKVGPTALKLNTSIHCQTKCGRCLSNVSFRNAPGIGLGSKSESANGGVTGALTCGVTYIL